MTHWKMTLRDFLAHDGRLLIEPSGRLVEAGTLPRWWNLPDCPQRSRALQAHRAFYAMQSDRSAGARFKRAARLLGRKTGNGWRVLEGAHTTR